jgi:hypothetical protein
VAVLEELSVIPVVVDAPTDVLPVEALPKDVSVPVEPIGIELVLEPVPILVPILVLPVPTPILVDAELLPVPVEVPPLDDEPTVAPPLVIPAFAALVEFVTMML